MKKYFGAPLLLFTLALVGGCATGTGGGLNGASNSVVRGNGARSHEFLAQALIFTAGRTSEIRLRSRVEIHVKVAVKSYRFENYLGRAARPATVVMLAVSGKSAGMSILTSRGVLIEEYTMGKVIADGSIIFDKTNKMGSRTYIRWVLADKSMGSFVERYDRKGNILSTELTTYRAK